MDYSLKPRSKGEIMDEEQEEEIDYSVFSSSDVSRNSSTSSLTDFMEDATSSSSSFSSPSSSLDQLSNGPLYDMSSLIQQLPFKRGLSKHYMGKSQSFTSLSKVTCLEDLAKPDNPFKKKLKSCKSYGGLLSENHKAFPPKICGKTISKKSSSKGSFYSLNSKRNNSFNKPPLSPHKTSNLSNETPFWVDHRVVVDEADFLCIQ